MKICIFISLSLLLLLANPLFCTSESFGKMEKTDSTFLQENWEWLTLTGSIIGSGISSIAGFAIYRLTQRINEFKESLKLWEESPQHNDQPTNGLTNLIHRMRTRYYQNDVGSNYRFEIEHNKDLRKAAYVLAGIGITLVLTSIGYAIYNIGFSETEEPTTADAFG